MRCISENDWIGVNEKKPPLYFIVFVMNGKRKMRAYFCSFVGWQAIGTRYGWKTRNLKNVTHWMEIKNFTFLQQHEENTR